MSEMRVELTDWMGSDLKVIQAAKQSFGRKADWLNGVVGQLSDNDKSLLKMLARGMGSKEYDELKEKIRITNDPDVIEELIWQFRHTTPHLAPFGHCFATFQFKLPVFVVRHLVKHEYIRISELSMRYVRDMPEYYKPKSWRAMADSVKQGSGSDHGEQSFFYSELNRLESYDGEEYEEHLAMGLAPEQARTFLRLCHMTEGHFSGSMDAIAGIVLKRLDSHAQEETRDMAKLIDKQMFDPFPLSWAALTEGVKRN